MDRMDSFSKPLTDIAEESASESSDVVAAPSPSIRKPFVFSKPTLKSATSILINISSNLRVRRMNDLFHMCADGSLEDDDVDADKDLADRASDVNRRDEECGWTPLIIASMKGLKKTVIKLLALGADVKVADTEGWTALHWATDNAHSEIVQLLLALPDADFNPTDGRGMTPLLLAARKGHTEIARIFLIEHVNLNLADHSGKTAVIWAALNGHVGMLVLLLQNNSDVIKYAGDFAVSIATNEGAGLVKDGLSTDVITILKNLYVDLNSEDKDGKTALIWAVINGHRGAVALLLDNDAVVVGTEIEKRDETGKTALIWATIKGDVEIITLLLMARANILAIDDNGVSVCEYAFTLGKPEVATALFMFLLENCETPSAEAIDDSEILSQRELLKVSDRKTSVLQRSLQFMTERLSRARTFFFSDKVSLFQQVARVDTIVAFDVITKSLAPVKQTLHASNNRLFLESLNCNFPLRCGEYAVAALDTTDPDFLDTYIESRGITEKSEGLCRVTLFTLPVAYPSGDAFLKMCLDIAEATGPAIFDNEVVIIALQHAWEDYGQKSHVILTLLYVLLMALNAALTYNFHEWSREALDEHYVGAWIIVSLVIMLNTLFFSFEVRQILNNGVEYLKDFFNYLDLSSYLLTYVGYILRISNEQETSLSASILAVAAVLKSLKFLYFLRPFKSTGPLVRMIFFILVQIRTFLLILIVVVFGFAQGFYLISFKKTVSDEFPDGEVQLFGLVDKALLYTFAYMQGAGPGDYGVFSKSSNESLGIFLVVLLSTIGNILLLNLLITIMGSAYGKVEENMIAEWRMEMCKILMELPPMMTVSTPKKLFFLKRDSDIKAEEDKNVNSSVVAVEALASGVNARFDELFKAQAALAKSQDAIIKAQAEMLALLQGDADNAPKRMRSSSSNYGMMLPRSTDR